MLQRFVPDGRHLAISWQISAVYGRPGSHYSPLSVAQHLIHSPAVDTCRLGELMQHDDERPRPAEQPDKAPETPTDEPKPAPVQDPPAEPDRAPYVVRNHQADKHRELGHE